MTPTDRAALHVAAKVVVVAWSYAPVVATGTLTPRGIGVLGWVSSPMIIMSMVHPAAVFISCPQSWHLAIVVILSSSGCPHDPRSL